MFAKFLCLAWRTDVVCFLCLVLKSVSVSPMYVLEVLLSFRVAVTVERAIFLLSAVACFVGFAVFVIFRVR